MTDEDATAASLLAMPWGRNSFSLVTTRSIAFR
jgi:hypothetical protein